MGVGTRHESHDDLRPAQSKLPRALSLWRDSSVDTSDATLNPDAVRFWLTPNPHTQQLKSTQLTSGDCAGGMSGEA